jgi:hypothetical protein
VPKAKSQPGRKSGALRLVLRTQPRSSAWGFAAVGFNRATRP